METVENSLAVPQKVKENYHSTQQSTSRYIPKRIENMDSDTYTQMFVAALFSIAKRRKQSK